MTSPLGIYVSVPLAGFRVPHAREYLETLPVPPPSTVYGMLLSLVGEEDRRRHLGEVLAIALLSRPTLSTVLRTTWRIKDKKVGPGLGNNRRPDYQELLADVRLAVWVSRSGESPGAPGLGERVAQALADPSAIRRFGGLALGESTHLVDELRPLQAGDLAAARFLVADADGDLSLPVWPDHVGSKGTHWGQYRLAHFVGDGAIPAEAWIVIKPLAGR